ncbi:unnamed protein product [marine sediment metagenome]|uniref:Uncharacterized protein n=1 Tax=marine sediment metagenome TaxID=412755 RepID=X1T0I4_9ZZZZ
MKMMENDPIFPTLSLVFSIMMGALVMLVSIINEGELTKFENILVIILLFGVIGIMNILETK